MEILIANLGKVRRVSLAGREYLVAPVTTVVPGVLNGSAGPLLYEAADCIDSVDSWNMIPIVVNHPKINGEFVTARRPDVLEKVGIGFLFNTQFNNQLEHEAWFDILNVRRIDPRIEKRLLAGLPLEVSTGLGFRPETAPEGSVYNGTPYIAITRDYKPDHLAVLPDGVGACSNLDGCGINVNSVEITTLVIDNSKFESDEQREAFFGKLKEFGVDPGNIKDSKTIKEVAKGPKPEKDKETVTKPDKKAAKEDSKGTEGFSDKELKDHPFKDKDHTQMIDSLIKEGTVRADLNNPRNYDKENFPKSVDGPKLVASVTKAISDAQQKNIGARPNIKDVYKAVKGDHPSMTLHDFHSSLAKMRKDEEISLHPWTTGFTQTDKHTLTAIMPIGRESMFYLDKGGKHKLLKNSDNTVTQNEETEVMDKAQLIQWFATNCDCWKKKEDQVILNKMDLDKLKKLKATVENAGKYTTLVANAKNVIAGNANDATAPAGYKLADLAKFFEVSIDPSEDPVGFIKELRSKIADVDTKLAGASAPDAEDVKDGGADDAMENPDGTLVAASDATTTTNRGKPNNKGATVPKKQSITEWENSMPEEARAVWNNAKTVDKETRESLVQLIVTNSASNGLYASDAEKVADYRELMGKSVPELKKLVKRLGKPNANNGNGNNGNGNGEPLPDWLGAVGGVVNTANFDPNDILPETRMVLPIVNNGRKSKTNKDTANNFD